MSRLKVHVNMAASEFTSSALPEMLSAKATMISIGLTVLPALPIVASASS